jgi:hypothetical protein
MNYEFIKKYHSDLNCESWNLGLSESKIERLRKFATLDRKVSTVDGGSIRTDGGFSDKTKAAWLLVTNSYSGGDPWSLGTAHKMCIHITHPAANDFADQLPIDATEVENTIIQYLEDAEFNVISLVVVHNAAAGFGGKLTPNDFGRDQNYGLRLAKLRSYASSIASMLKSCYPILFKYAHNESNLHIAALAREINPILYSEIISEMGLTPVMRYEDITGAILASMKVRAREIILSTDRGTFTIYASNDIVETSGNQTDVLDSPVAVDIYDSLEYTIVVIYNLDKGRVWDYSAWSKIHTKYAIYQTI